MENLKVIDNEGNVVFLKPIKVTSRYQVSKLDLNSSSIDVKDYARGLITHNLAKEIGKNLFFTETELPDGSIIIEARTVFYGI